MLYGITTISAVELSALRLAVATPVLLVCCWVVLGRRALRIARRDVLIALASGFPVVLSQVAYAAAVAETSIAISTLITLCIAPVVVAIGSVPLFGERLTPRILAALGSAVIGTALLVGPPQLDLTIERTTLSGAALALVAALSYAAATLLQRLVIGRCHPLQVITLGASAGLLMLLPVWVTEGPTGILSAPAWGLLVYIGLFQPCWLTSSCSMAFGTQPPRPRRSLPCSRQP